MQESIYSVSQLTLLIKQLLENRFNEILIEGEISNLKKQSSGHYYFSIKDAQAQISAVLFKGKASALIRPPKEGDQVVAKASISVYAPRGNYQLIVSELKYKGVGDLLLRLEELKKEIHKRGWFSSKFKKSIPTLPQRIGVVTSPTGAVIQDILNVLHRRFPNFHLTLYPVKVQGEGAAKEIATAIDEMNTHQLADVLIIGRGGGSIEDLWAFNEECVAEAIFNSSIPIIAAVGHETDHCIAEYVADLRAPTPTAAAQLVILDKHEAVQKLKQWEARFSHSLEVKLKHAKQHLESILKQPLLRTPQLLIAPYYQWLDDTKGKLDNLITQEIKEKKLKLKALQQKTYALNPQLKLQQVKNTLTNYHRLLTQAINKIVEKEKARLRHITQALRLIDPKNLLQQGYSIVFSEKDHTVIVDTDQINVNDKICIQLAKGKILSTVKEINTSDGKQKETSRV
jgi:exodeoxyribonuclease VII large subunit